MPAKPDTTNSLTPSTHVKKKPNKNYFKKDSDKQRAVAAYASTGSVSATSRITGLNETTIRYWLKQEWFGEELKALDRQDSEEIRSTFTNIAKKATIELIDRIERGDEVVTKDGEVVLKKISGKDLAVISGIATQNRKNLHDTEVTGTVLSTNQKLLNLMEEFVKFSKAKTIDASDFREISESATSEGDAEEPSLRSGDESTPESGGLEEGNEPSHIEGSSKRVNDPGPESDGSGLPVFSQKPFHK